MEPRHRKRRMGSRRGGRGWRLGDDSGGGKVARLKPHLDSPAPWLRMGLCRRAWSREETARAGICCGSDYGAKWGHVGVVAGGGESASERDGSHTTRGPWLLGSSS
eukprot:scaffold9816_cov141-Isochrysis_galbana.AAC.2